MNLVFRTVLSLSLSGALLIAVLLLCRPLYRERATRRWQYYIWLIVAARLLLPIAPEWNLAGHWFQPGEEVLTAEQQLPAVQSDLPDTSQPVIPVDPVTVVVSQSPGAWAPDNLWLLWLGGALLLLGRKLIIYRRFVRSVRRGWAAVEDPETLDRLSRLGEQMGLRYPVDLYTNPLLCSPMLLGVALPCVVLPTADLPPEDLDHILRHELTHCRRGDLIYKWLLQLTLCVHWFNPLVWWMNREVERCCELACDEAVLASLPPQDRRSYGDTLLRSLEQGGGCKPSVAAVTLTESAQRLKERLGAIMKYTGKKKWAAVTVLLTLVLVACALVAGPYTGQGRAVTADALWGSGGYFTQVEICGNQMEPYDTPSGTHCGPYLFAVSWPVEEWEMEPQESFLLWDDVEKKAVTLTVRLGSGGRKVIQDAQAEEYLYGLLAKLYCDTREADTQAVHFRLDWMDYVGDDGPAALAERYVQNGWVEPFEAVFPLLDEQEQADLIARMEDENWKAFASSFQSREGGYSVRQTLFSAPYVFDLAWNFDPAWNVPDGEGQTITVWDEARQEDATLFVTFAPDCAALWEDETFRQALMEQVKEIYLEGYTPQATHFRVMGAEYVGNVPPWGSMPAP